MMDKKQSDKNVPFDGLYVDYDDKRSYKEIKKKIKELRDLVTTRSRLATITLSTEGKRNFKFKQEDRKLSSVNKYYRQNPQFVSTSGPFYEHDIRNDKDDYLRYGSSKSSKKSTSTTKGPERWTHDRYDSDEQAPKTTEELKREYGYDIRDDYLRYGSSKSSKKSTSTTKGPERWTHDRYDSDEQAPKTTEELKREYGYDIRDDYLRYGSSKSSKKSTSTTKGPERWTHDRYDSDEQAPKTTEELKREYGYDIREGDFPPALRKGKKYGRDRC